MNLKIMILPAMMATGLSAIYFLPSAGAVANTAIRMELPQEDGGWLFRKNLPSKAEIEGLARDTEFSKATCLRVRPGEFTEDGYSNADVLDLSIVLSGYDINNSIHRPERCMPAQGHSILSSSDVPIQLSNGRTLTVKRLLSKRRITSEDPAKERELECLTYYFFVGHHRVTHDHLKRTLFDMEDRVLKGMDQRWAYASLSMSFGKMPWYDRVEITQEEADRKLKEFLKEFAEKQINWQQVAP